MPDVKVKAVVTRAVPYKESDMIVTLVSVEEGKITASVRGCLKPNAKLRYAAEPMNFGEYVLAGKNGRYIVTECSQIDSFMPITADLDKYYAAAFILDLLQKLSDVPSPELFVAAVSSLKDLAYNGAEAGNTVTELLLETLRMNGSSLDFKHCAVCKCDLDASAAFSTQDGIVCPHCAGSIAIPFDALSRAYLAGNFPDAPEGIKDKANMLLCDIVYTLLGVKPNVRYFTEQK